MPHGLIVLEIFLGFCVPIAWAAWELVQLRREKLKDAAKSMPVEEKAAPARVFEPRSGGRS